MAESVPRFSHIYPFMPEDVSPEAQFLVTDWGMKPAMASGCRTGPSAYVAWQPDAIAGFIPQPGTKNKATEQSPKHVWVS
jgi:hypothetical protein